MSEKVGKYTVQTGSTLHRGDPEVHDPFGREPSNPGPSTDYSGGRAAKNKSGLEKYTVPASDNPGRPKSWN
jgi:hypothetical protein